MATLTPEETKRILDSLFALADAKKPTKKPTKKLVEKGELEANEIARAIPHGMTAKVTLWEVVHQECAGCGEQHTYIRNRLVRFEQQKPTPLHTALEIATSVPNTIPNKVEHCWEKVDFCPTCIAINQTIDGYFDAPRAVQLSLFN